MNFILGNWEEKIDSNDFIRLNKNISINNNYKREAGMRKESRIKRLPVRFSGSERKNEIFNIKTILETDEQKKLEEHFIFDTIKLDEVIDFVYPDFTAIALYGTKSLIKHRKEYIHRMDKQFQNLEWYGRKLKLVKEIESLDKLEIFAMQQGVKISKPCNSAIGFINAVYTGVVYGLTVGEEMNSTLYNTLEMLDIFIQNDLELGKISNREANEILEEFIERIEELMVSQEVTEDFGFYFTLNTDNINATSILAAKIISERETNISIQLILGEKELSDEIVKTIIELFDSGTKLSISQSFRKTNTHDLELTKYQSFFKKGTDNVFTLGSMNLEEVFLLSINNGKNYRTGALVNKVTKSANLEDGFEFIFNKYEMYLRYFINIYIEKINLNLFVLDTNNTNGFETALVDSFPNFLVNVMFHRINPMITILTAIKSNDFVVKRNNRDLIRKISPKNNDKDVEIADRINDIIHSELNKMNLYKRAKHSVGYFAETPFYKEVDKFDLNHLHSSVFEKSSLSGFISIDRAEFMELLSNFKNKGYSHVRILNNKC